MLAGLIACDSPSGLSIDNCLICISPNGLLMGFEPIESIALNGDVCIAYKVLEQSTAIEETVEFARTNLHQIAVACQQSIKDSGEGEVYTCNMTPA